MKKVIVMMVLVVLVGLALYFGLFGGDKNGGGLTFVGVKTSDIAEKALAVGTIEPEKEIRVKSTISGIVSEVFFKVGDRIEKDDPLFKVSPNPTPLEYVEAQRNMEVAKMTLDKALADRERQVKLFKSDLISTQVMEDVENRYEDAALRARMARERFQLLEKGRIQMSNRVIDSVIKSPIDGIVLQQTVFEGDPVVPLTNFQPGTELCSMADMSKLRFKGTVDEIDVGKLLPDMLADLQIGALSEARVKGQLIRIYPKARKEGNATLFDIEIAITDFDNRTLRAGYSATAYVKVHEKQGVLVIPERLVTFDGEKRFVELKTGETTEKKAVVTGLSDGLNIEIVSGLKAGDQVVERPPREIE
jgi:HlyD family secretion protein